MDPEVEEYLLTHPTNPLPTDTTAFRTISHAIETAQISRLGPPSPSIAESHLTIPMRDAHPNPCILFHPSTPHPNGNPLIILFHGGGFAVGSPSQFTLLGRALASLLDCVVLSAGYRLAPEHVFPTGVQDAWDTVRYVASNACPGTDLSKGFIISGASSGASLAAVAAQLAKDEHLSPPLTGQYLSLPLVLWEGIVPAPYADKYLSGSIKTNTSDPIQTVESLHAIIARYSPDIHSPLFSPLNSPSGPSGLPKTYIQVCGLDPLRDDGVIYEEILRVEGGVQTRLDVYEGFPHGWWLFMPELESSLRAVGDMVRGVAWLLGREGVDEGRVRGYLREKIGPGML